MIVDPAPISAISEFNLWYLECFWEGRRFLRNNVRREAIENDGAPLPERGEEGLSKLNNHGLRSQVIHVVERRNGIPHESADIPEITCTVGRRGEGFNEFYC